MLQRRHGRGHGRRLVSGPGRVLPLKLPGPAESAPWQAVRRRITLSKESSVCSAGHEIFALAVYADSGWLTETRQKGDMEAWRHVEESEK